MKKGSPAALIVALVLAVPGFFFYRWWSQQSAANKAELEMRVRKRTGNIPMFGSKSSQLPSSKLENPLDKPAPAPVPGAGVAASTGAAVAVSTQATPAPLAQSTSPIAAPPVAGTPSASSSVASSSETLVALARDPMLSPYDMVRIEQLALEAELRRKELVGGHASTHKVVRRVIEHPVENDIDLQGIVTTDEGNKAIINGEMVAEGELVKGAKVVKIAAQAVVFNYKGRRFSKTISK